MQKLRWAAKKWWFWVGVVVLIPIVWYVWGYASWWTAGADSRAENRQAYEGWLAMEAESVALEAQYRADTYGGATPEETLRLFIEALEKRDYELAAKYSVPEKQEEDLKKMSQGVASGGFSALINAYRTGVVKSTPYQSGNKYEIEVYPQSSDVPFGFIFLLNPFTQKWKILE